MTEDADRQFLTPGARFGRYELIRPIAAGGMGEVFEAQHVELKKRVAFKALHSSLAEDPDARERFLHEGKAACRIHHPNVVQIFDVGIEHDVPYLVMEYLEGENLTALLDREGPLSPKRIAHVMLPVIAAVATAHEEGVLHRDLKPDNIFLHEGKHGFLEPKLLDFGISKVVDGAEAVLTGGGTLIGTPMYMSPEQATRARPLDERSDQYSLGVILYEATTGEDPFHGETLYTLLQAIVSGEFKRPSEHRPLMPQALESLVERAMSAEPEFRFPNLPALARALLQFADERDRAIWGPAYEASRAAGTPVIPSDAPRARKYTPRMDDTEPEFRVDRPSPDPGLHSEPGSQPSDPFDSTPDRDLPEARGNRGAVTPLRAAAPASPPAPLASPLHELALPSPGIPREALPRHNHLRLGLAGAATVVLCAAVLFTIKGRGHLDSRPPPSAVPVAQGPLPNPPAQYTVRVQTIPETAQLVLDGKPVGVGGVDLRLPKDGRPHEMALSAEGYADKVVRFTDAPPPEHISLTPQAKAAGVEGDTGKTRARRSKARPQRDGSRPPAQRRRTHLAEQATTRPEPPTPAAPPTANAQPESPSQPVAKPAPLPVQVYEVSANDAPILE